MKKVKSSVRRMGFSLVEMLVVIGILAILIAALLPMLGGSRDGALKTQCLNNMRNLAQALLSCAQSNDEGHFPAAGLYRSVSPKVHKGRGKVVYDAHRPWISNKGDATALNEQNTSVFLGDVAHFTDTGEDCRFAITNGAIWSATGKSFEVYRCPAHANSFVAKHKRQPGWSYMMNQEFGYNQGGGNKPIDHFGASIKSQIKPASGNTEYRKEKDPTRSPDKVLLLAEIQGVELTGKNGVSLKPVNSSRGTDAVLEYMQESMGFNHKLSKFKFGGNVAFADGHVETFVMPVPSEMSTKDLTRYLCQGYPGVPNDGRKYTPSADDK